MRTPRTPTDLVLKLPPDFKRIDFFVRCLEKIIGKLLRADRRRVMIQMQYNEGYQYTFKVLYYPTGGSFADLPHPLPQSVIDKLKRSHLVNASFKTEEEYDKLTGKKLKITYMRLPSKLNKSMRSMVSEHIMMNKVTDFFNYDEV